MAMAIAFNFDAMESNLNCTFATQNIDIQMLCWHLTWILAIVLFTVLIRLLVITGIHEATRIYCYRMAIEAYRWWILVACIRSRVFSCCGFMSTSTEFGLYIQCMLTCTSSNMESAPMTNVLTPILLDFFFTSIHTQEFTAVLVGRIKIKSTLRLFTLLRIDHCMQRHINVYR